MNSLERAKKAFWFMVTICIVALAWGVVNIQKDLHDQKNQIRDLNYYYKTVTAYSMDNYERLIVLEEAMWLEGYEHTREESMPHMNNRLLLKDFRSILMNTVHIDKMWKEMWLDYAEVDPAINLIRIMWSER